MPLSHNRSNCISHPACRRSCCDPFQQTPSQAELRFLIFDTFPIPEPDLKVPPTPRCLRPLAQNHPQTGVNKQCLPLNAPKRIMSPSGEVTFLWGTKRAFISGGPALHQQWLNTMSFPSSHTYKSPQPILRPALLQFLPTNRPLQSIQIPPESQYLSEPIP